MNILHLIISILAVAGIVYAGLTAIGGAYVTALIIVVVVLAVLWILQALGFYAFPGRARV